MPPLVSFQNFDLSKSFCIDYMHQTLLGVLRSLLASWTDTPNNKQPYYITKPKRDELNNRIASIKFPSYISRRPRSLEKMHLFKSSEYRNLLLYILPICLDRLIPQKFIIHLHKLSKAIYTLLKTTVTEAELSETDEQLRLFVDQYEQYFGRVNMKMNIHSLLHLVSSVRHFGPLWCYSMFTFESYNGFLKSFVVAPNDFLYQITTRYIGSKILPAKPVDRTVGLKDKTNVSFDMDGLKEALGDYTSDGEIVCYCRYEKDNTQFTSKVYSRAKQTIDYIIITNENIIGQVGFYFASNSIPYALIEVIETQENLIHISKVKFTRKYRVIKADSIVDRCIYMRFENQDFIVIRPNPFERN